MECPECVTAKKLAAPISIVLICDSNVYTIMNMRVIVFFTTIRQEDFIYLYYSCENIKIIKQDMTLKEQKSKGSRFIFAVYTGEDIVEKLAYVRQGIQMLHVCYAWFA